MIFRIVLRLAEHLLTKAFKKRSQDEAARERPLLDVEEEHRAAQEAANRHWEETR